MGLLSFLIYCETKQKEVGCVPCEPPLFSVGLILVQHAIFSLFVHSHHRVKSVLSLFNGLSLCVDMASLNDGEKHLHVPASIWNNTGW